VPNISLQTQKLLIHPEPANAEPNSQAAADIGTSLNSNSDKEI
jgi:hypothetical protein